jgi:ABC-type antimicrobial peptide transport system permease subunit
MIPVKKLTRIVVANTVRSPRHFVLSVFGIVIGIASFVFFLGLSMGVRNVVLGQIFPIEQVEVVAPRASFLGKDVTKRIDDAIVDKIRARKEVASAVPRMTVAFPASGRGWFEGQELKFEVGGFCDGIDPDFVADEHFAELFQDWESPEHQARQEPCGPAPEYTCGDPSLYYCDRRDMKCHHRVPVIVSQTLLEIYNGQFAKSHNLPAIGALEQFIAERGGLGKMRFYIGLGETMVAGSNEHIPAHKRREVQGVLIGISTKAMPIGMTVPIQYVRRWNQEFSGDEAASSYSSVIVTLDDKDGVAPFSAWLQSELDLRLEDSMGERFATAIFIVTSLFVLISFIIVSISAINIAHNFFMQVSERRREIGVLRAVGATRADVRFIILGEAALIGVIGGLLGIGLAWLAAWGVDLASTRLLPPFPFKPETYFDFQTWILVGGLLFATLFCVLGGFLPARKASLMEPAQALAQN